MVAFYSAILPLRLFSCGPLRGAVSIFRDRNRPLNVVCGLRHNPHNSPHIDISARIGHYGKWRCFSMLFCRKNLLSFQARFSVAARENRTQRERFSGIVQSTESSPRRRIASYAFGFARARLAMRLTHTGAIFCAGDSSRRSPFLPAPIWPGWRGPAAGEGVPGARRSSARALKAGLWRRRKAPPGAASAGSISSRQVGRPPFRFCYRPTE